MVIEVFGGVLFGIAVGAFIGSEREENRQEREKNKMRNQLKFFWKRRDFEESTHMIIMDAIACGLDINKVLEIDGNSRYIYDYWESYQNENFRYEDKWSYIKKKEVKQVKSERNIYTPYEFRPSDIPLKKYKHLKPYSGTHNGFFDYENIEKLSFSVRDLKE